MYTYTFETPSIVKWIYPSLTWQMPDDGHSVYLTFDDGPHPEITPQVLSQLEMAKAKASFFCVGENVARYPEVIHQIRSQGHSLGNHTQHHLNGFKTDLETYLADVAACQSLLNTRLFRPPYGKISRRQLQALVQDYRIIMWSQLSGDFDKELNPEKFIRHLEKRLKPGDIIVLHDSEKAAQNLFYLLPRLLELCQQRNFELKAIPQ